MEKEVLIPVAELRINNRNYPLYEGVNTIGRNRQAVVNIANLNISQNHSIIVILNGKHYISDLKSSNGTFLNDSKLTPLKLFPLINNATLTFGTISGSFVSDGEFSDQVQQSQTSFATQSFFEKNTQLIDSNTTQNLEFHDAPTQEFTWSNVKSKAQLPPVPKAIFEEPVNNCSDIQENGITVKENLLNDQKNEIVNGENSATNVELVSQSHVEVELVDNEVKICEAHNTNLTFYPEEDNDLSDTVYSGIGVGDEENAEAARNVDDDLTDYEEEPFKHVTAEESVVNPTEGSERPSCPVFCGVPDDDLTDCEEDAADSEKNPEADATNEENVAVQQDVENDDDLTDCEEKPNESPVLATTSSLSKSVQNDDDDLTDCEDNFKLHSSLTKSPVTVKEDSNESVKFLLGNSCGDVNVNEPNSDSEDSDSVIGVPNTNKKCGMVISTQNDPDEPTADSDEINHSSDEVRSCRKSRKSFMVISTQDFTESSETQVYDISTKEYTDCDISIPATQDVTGIDLDDTDCIPATQDVKVSANPRSQSTEESFKLGVTQMMDEDADAHPSQGYTVNLGETVINNVKETHPNKESDVNEDVDDSFLAPTQKFVMESKTSHGATEFYDGPTQKNTEDCADQENDDLFSAPTQKVSSRNSELNDKDLFTAPTQKISTQDSQKLLTESTKMQEDPEFYDGPTQILTGAITDKEDELFSAPTQKASFASRNSELNGTDLFTAPTQKIIQASTQIDSVCMAPTQKLLTNTEKTQEELEFYDGPTQIFNRTKEELFSAPTQKVSVASRHSELNDTDLMTAPTQKIIDLSTQDSVCMTPTQKLFNLKETKKIQEETEFYDGPTQKVVEVSTQDEACLAPPLKFSDNKTDDFYDGPTQKLNTEALERKYESVDDICSAPTQKLATSLSIQEEGTGIKEADAKVEEGKKKVFTFKKVTCNLEESLSEIIGITPVKSKIKDSRTNTKIVTEALKDQVEPCKVVPDGAINLNTLPSEPTDFGTTADTAEPKEPSINKAESNVLLPKSVTESKTPTEAKPPEPNSRNNESAINVNVEMDQSIAILEAKFHKTRKAKTGSKIDLSVPKKRPSMSLSSVVEDASEASVYIKPKKARKTTKTSETSLEPVKKRTTKTVNKDSKPSSSGRRNNQETIDAPSRRSKRNTSASVVESNESFTGSAGSRQNIENLDNIKEVEVKVSKARKSKAECLGQSNKTNESFAGSAATRQNIGKLNSIKEVEVEVNKGRKSKAECLGRSNKTQAEVSDSLIENNERLTEAEPVNGNKTSEQSEQTVSTSRITRKDSSKSSVEVTNSKPSRGKRKKIESVKSETDLTIEHLNSPKRQKTELNLTGLSTPQRGRRQKPKVVFTMMESPQLESLIKSMGGSIVDSIKTCSVLITEHVKRSQKLLSAIGLGVPICSPKWVTDSKKQHDFLDPWDYILTDPEAEDKWQFSLKESLKRSRDKKLLAEYIFNIQVASAAEVLKGAIESCGGKCISKIPSAAPDNLYIVSTIENKSKYSRIIKKHSHIKVIEPEAIFDGVLRQELRFQRHILS